MRNPCPFESNVHYSTMYGPNIQTAFSRGDFDMNERSDVMCRVRGMAAGCNNGKVHRTTETHSFTT